VAEPGIHDLVDTLKEKLKRTPEPFVWSAVELETIRMELPNEIKSCWIFVLKKDVPSGCHYHPNSVQHMAMIEGEGTSRVGSISKEMPRLEEMNALPDDIWYVIDKGVPHEFFPREKDMVVISFHTCNSDELEEISCDSGATRHYESGT
jgi:mannose-6-phosphate isomerase-like protein (cupin superfamily)